MTSVEPNRKSAYTADYAIRVVCMRLGMDLTFRSIANRLQIGLGSAYRIYHRFEQNLLQMQELHELYILGLVMENLGLYLIEICQKIFEATGVTVSGPTVCRALKRNGYTRKKIKQVGVKYLEDSLCPKSYSSLVNFLSGLMRWDQTRGTKFVDLAIL